VTPASNTGTAPETPANGGVRASRAPAPEQRRRRPRITVNERVAFLAALRAGWTVTHAAERAGRDKRRFYDLREADEAFAAEWDGALEEGTAVLEDELHRRALEGWEDTEHNGAGELVRRIRRYSPALLIFSLKARKPDTYRDNARIELAGNVCNEVRTTIRHERGLTMVDVLRFARNLGPDAHQGVVDGLISAMERRGALTPEALEELNSWCRQAEEESERPMLALRAGEAA
jgi:hypothetical protein